MALTMNAMSEQEIPYILKDFQKLNLLQIDDEFEVNSSNHCQTKLLGLNLKIIQIENFSYKTEPTLRNFFHKELNAPHPSFNYFNNITNQTIEKVDENQFAEKTNMEFCFLDENNIDHFDSNLIGYILHQFKGNYEYVRSTSSTKDSTKNEVKKN